MEAIAFAKAYAIFKIAEKVAYGVVGLLAAKIAFRYVKDYKESVDEEKYFNK